jgi:hypothetical protein
MTGRGGRRLFNTLASFENSGLGFARPVKYEHYFFGFLGTDSEETELNL